MLAMPTPDEVEQAWRAIDEARSTYRTTLRAYLDEGADEGKRGRQAEMARRLNRSREMLRRDAMTTGERDELRRAETEQKRTTKKATTKKATKRRSTP